MAYDDAREDLLLDWRSITTRTTYTNNWYVPELTILMIDTFGSKYPVSEL